VVAVKARLRWGFSSGAEQAAALKGVKQDERWPYQNGREDEHDDEGDESGTGGAGVVEGEGGTWQ
jgi:hypothetical protein